MVAEMLYIAITAPGKTEQETLKICRLIECGHHAVHLRKPDFSFSETEALIKAIPADFHPYIVLHDHHTLIREYKLKGIHINSRNPAPLEGYPYTVGCHEVSEFDKWPDADYLFLSPVFDSISKNGYRARFNIGDLSPAIKGRKIVALGGVTPDSFNMLKSVGFIGGAMLGAVWNDFDKYLETIKLHK